MNITDIIEKNKKGIILIDVQVPGEASQVKISIKGTGFIISPDGKFLTNAHVYRQIQENEKDFMGVSVPGQTDEKGLTHYDRFKIESVSIDDENDIALLKIISDRKDFAAIGELEPGETLKEGEEVVYIGYPLAIELLNMGFGITMTANKAIVSSVKRRMDGSFHFFLIDGHINNGSSGSPVFSTDTGKVVGIASAKISAKVQLPNNQVADIPANMGICRPIKYAIGLVGNNP